ncbi:hypothetical protein PGB28_15915 [Primorskyibacter aestuariivivens]|uniref:hypothetical protein n=1 Tax=Primorskyibacter aestuariivivens TaxID=1888912 RepID=UPI00230053A4|nr:hypothetical protein [Primorskyibacter aestuariivivens]MDA7429952.1 hypothetical protein [Primorskyibacter aestuariivivens]
MKLPLNLKMPEINLPFGRSGTSDADPAEAAERAPKPGLSGRTRLIAGTALAVFGIGYLMQNVMGGPTPQQLPKRGAEAQSMQVENVMPTASDMASATLNAGMLTQPAPEPAREMTNTASSRIEVLEDVAQDGAQPVALGDLEPIQTAALDEVEPELPKTESVPELSCDMTLDAVSAPAATVDLTLSAPCLPNERLTMHHNGMMFTAVTDASGQSRMRVPALSENAVFIVSFTNGEGAVTQIDVPTLEFFDRVVLQWRGKSGLGVHALEFGAEYFGKGHIHAETTGDVAATAKGESGFLMRYGVDAGPEALMAEVYTFPTGTAVRDGRIALSVEAEVTGANCGTKVDAQTLQIRPGEALRTQDLELFVPDCDAVGDFLVLNNLLQDLKVASN